MAHGLQQLWYAKKLPKCECHLGDGVLDRYMGELGSRKGSATDTLCAHG